ncbi:GntR family transcriptional regulator [Rhizobium sp. KVB221]|uniref:GntR family transcriptional regulator n=1 Tax=Rhizobium setariae TaxID=2801340 RepID=A0A936YPU1_9HYPH|nr:GntR family transcriptional regulator [Rhizobium setariae]
MKETFEQIDKGSLYDAIYSQIGLALVEGRLQPNDKIRIRAVAAQLGVSVTPVRDAVLRLVRDGALEMRGYKDVRVPNMTLEQFEEIRMIRLRLEGLAASLAATTFQEPAEKILVEILEKNETAREQGALAEAVRLNRLFHSKVAEFSGLPMLSDMIENLWLRMGPIISAIYDKGGRAMIAYHYEILAALQERNPVAAEAAIQADINATAEILRASGLLTSTSLETQREI